MPVWQNRHSSIDIHHEDNSYESYDFVHVYGSMLRVYCDHLFVYIFTHNIYKTSSSQRNALYNTIHP